MTTHDFVHLHEHHARLDRAATARRGRAVRPASTRSVRTAMQGLALAVRRRATRRLARRAARSTNPGTVAHVRGR